MNPQEVKDFFGTLYNFRKQTKMAHASLINWIKWGYVPEGSQYKLERITKGALKAEWIEGD